MKIIDKIKKFFSGSPLQYIITVNGREVTTTKVMLTYNDIMEMIEGNDNIIYTVTYYNSTYGLSGSLKPNDDQILTIDGTNITAVITGNA